jgi:hypothetical protein
MQLFIKHSVEIIQKHESPNNSLNLLVSLDAQGYKNILSSFFEEAGRAVNVNTGCPCLEVGDIL